MSDETKAAILEVGGIAGVRQERDVAEHGVRVDRRAVLEAANAEKGKPVSVPTPARLHCSNLKGGRDVLR